MQMKQQLKGEISIRLHITTSDKLILNLTRNARNEIVTNENMNKTNTNHNSPCTCFQGPTQCVEYFIFLVKTIYLRETGGINAKGLKLHNATIVNPFAPGNFAEKRVLKLVEWFSGHCCAIKS